MIWGCSFWWIDVALRSLSPLGVAFGRLAIGTMTLAAIARVTGARLPRNWRVWGHLLVLGLTFNSLPFTLFAYAESHVSSSLAGILNSLTPIATLVVSTSVFGAERPSKRAQGGILLGVVGAVIVAGVWEGVGHSQQLGVGACLLAVASFAVAFSYSSRFVTGRGEPLSLATGQLVCGTIMLLPLAAAFGLTRGPCSVAPLLALVALGSLGTGIAYVLNFDIGRSASPTVASSVTYIMPVVAVVAGAVFLREAISWYQPFGGAVILVGAALSQRARRAGGTASGHVSCRPARPAG